MKRAIVIGTVVVATALAGAGAIYGPELVAGYRFMNTLDEHNARYLANGGAWPQLQDTCALCHGARASRQTPDMPPWLDNPQPISRRSCRPSRKGAGTVRK